MSELEIIRHGQINGVTVFFDTVEYRTPHFHPEWELVWVTGGTLLLSSGQTEERYETGELCLLPPKRIHAYTAADREVTFLCLQIAPQVFSYVFPKLQALTTDSFRPGRYLGKPELQQIRSSFRTLAEAYFSEAPYAELSSAEICAKILRILLSGMPVRPLSPEEVTSADKRNARLDRFVRYVEEHYADKPSLEEFAKAEHCSVSYMSRFLKANLNQNFQEYVTFVRFRNACRLIEAGAARMIEVCEMSGFSDYRYFSECFKRRCHMTPEEYRLSRPAVSSGPAVRRGASSERFYTREESRKLLETV